MNHFVEALEKSIESQNWYSVLFISLTLPDICGKIDEPNGSSKQRTINWFNKYLAPLYTSNLILQGKNHVFLSGSDFYALRCAYLHEGSHDIRDQRAQEVLENFRFIQPLQPGILIHKNQINGTLQLQVERFGEEVLGAIKQWMKDIGNDKNKIEKLGNMLNIEIIDLARGFTL